MPGSDDAAETASLDAWDRRLINRLQDGMPVCERPYRAVAQELGMAEDDLLARLRRLLDVGLLSRFGPMYHAGRMGGDLALAAMKIPPADFERVNALVNRLPEIAHNYERNHAFNMWFVIATDTPAGVAAVVEKIESLTGYPVYNMPKIEEFYVGLRFVL